MTNSPYKKTIGILGGMGPAASANLYQELIDLAQKKYGAKQDHEFPPMVMYSLPLLDWDTTGFLNPESVKRQLIKGVKLLERAGCDFIILGCNTIHYFYKEMQAQVRIPIINMVEETTRLVWGGGYRQATVLSTLSSKKLGVYRNILERYNVSMVAITPEQQETVTTVIAHVEAGVQTVADTMALKDIVQETGQRGSEAVILGCTELPIVLKQTDVSLPVFDSSAIIAESALAQAYCPAPAQRTSIILEKYITLNKTTSVRARFLSPAPFLAT